MRAAVLREIPGKLEVDDIDIDKPGPREVLIRTAAAGLCHSDLHFIEGKFPYFTPVVMGHESAGIVEQVGELVDYVKPGDHVITCLSVFCGNCEYCLSGKPSLCSGRGTSRGQAESSRLSQNGETVHQFANLSSFAEQMLVHEHAVVKIKEEMPLDRAALIGCGVMTGMGAAIHTAKVTPGSSVAVIGCGGVGLSAIQGASIAGARTVIAIDRLPHKLELAKKFGATEVVDASSADPVEAVKELTRGGVEFSFEAIGLKETSEQAFKMLRRAGTATIIGMVPIGQNLELPAIDFLQERKIQGSAMGSNRFRVDMPRFVDFYLSGRMKLDELISERIKLDEVNDGFEAMARGDIARDVIVFEG